MSEESRFSLYGHESILPEGVFRHPQGPLVFAGRYTSPTEDDIVTLLQREARGEYLDSRRYRKIISLLEGDSVLVAPFLRQEPDAASSILQRFIPRSFPTSRNMAREHLLVEYATLKPGANPRSVEDYKQDSNTAWNLAIMLTEGELPTMREMKHRDPTVPAPLQLLKVSDTRIPRVLLDEVLEAVYLGNHEADEIAALPDYSHDVLYNAAYATLRNAWDTLREARRSEGLALAGRLLRGSDGGSFSA